LVKAFGLHAVKSGPSRKGVPLPRFVPPQLSQSVKEPPSGPQWLHEIKLDGYRMAARIEDGRVQLHTRRLRRRRAREHQREDRLLISVEI
jgi:ATP-dependent DNA ligase